MPAHQAFLHYEYTHIHQKLHPLYTQSTSNGYTYNVVFSLLCVFPALQAMRYCDANIPAMDKTKYLVNRVDYSLLSSQPVLNDNGLFGPMNGELCDGVNDEFSTVFGEFGEEEFPSDDPSR